MSPDHLPTNGFHGAMLYPQPPHEEAVDKAMASLILLLFPHLDPLKTSVTRLVSGVQVPPPDTLEGSFRVRNGAGDDWLLKLVNSVLAARLGAAESFVQMLPSLGVASNLSIPVGPMGWPRPGPNGLTAFLVPYLSGRYPSAAKTDIEATATAIAKLHRTLREHPIASKIAVAGARHEAKLSKYWPRVVSRYAPEHLQYRVAKFMQSDYMQMLDERDAQPLHGDLNPGNILLLENDHVAILDFEDAPSRFGSVETDLALAIERICCLCSNIREIQTKTRHFIECYGKEAGTVPFGKPGALHQFLIFQNVRALCVLAARSEIGDATNPDEWGKFVGLLERHRSVKSVQYQDGGSY
jgi:hypothetical protein